MNPVLLGAFLLYLSFLVFYVIWSAFLAYHLLRFAPNRGAARLGIGFFAGVTLFLLLLSFAAFSQLDWSAPFALPTVRF